MYCTNCGHANAEGSRFCEQCGKPLEPGQPAQPSWQGAGYAPPVAKTSAPIWSLVSLIAGAAVVLGFILPWMSAGLFGYNVRISGLTFIYYIFRIIFSGLLGWLDGGEAVLLVLAFLIIMAILVVIAMMAVKIILAAVKLVSDKVNLPGESDAIAAKIKRYSIVGLILLGVYFFLVMVVIGGIMSDGLFSLNTLGFGFWLCVIGFVVTLLAVTVVKKQNI